MKLKPCPFCGCEVDTLKEDDLGHYIICYCEMQPTTDYYDTEEQAANAWNTRNDYDVMLSKRTARLQSLYKELVKLTKEFDEWFDEDGVPK